MDLQEPTPTLDTKRESHGRPEEASDDEDEEDSSSGYSTNVEDPTPLWVTLTSLTETGQDEWTIPVLKQRSYTWIEAISSALADTLCTDLGIHGVLKELNTALGTSYNLDSVISILDPYIAQNVDFGTAYAYLRPYWDDIPNMAHRLRTREVEDMEMRRNALTDGWIAHRDVDPRRVWDLHANRVVPYWVLGSEPWGISHAWVDERDCINVMMPINGCEWPMPMPKGANLDLIRIEMLNWGAEYAWLDVLCLR
ncbi:hypothetical protein EDD18DRAFT_1349533 [Armillaria luteobubalina]|uniref:Heterokaryon incompatibility domain-containing protein n=1 Tax=Armillaria luteobubalina TaxID=153913 RepID=A0AA39QAL1_9AGAR|nr:hypothetical protein EDD18DRAFT_1349533 [Armillaria luteobubalina]